MRSRSSAPVKAGRSIPFSFIASAIWGPWFHSAVATRTGEAKTFIASSDGPTLPPAPPTWWQTAHCFAAKSLRPFSRLPGGSK